MSAIFRKFLVDRNQFSLGVVNFLIEPERRLIRVNDLHVSRPITLPPKNIIPISASSVWQVFPILEAAFILLSGCHDSPFRCHNAIITIAASAASTPTHCPRVRRSFRISHASQTVEAGYSDPSTAATSSRPRRAASA